VLSATPSRQAACIGTMSIAVSACAALVEPHCAAHEQSAVQDSLYFGTERAHRCRHFGGMVQVPRGRSYSSLSAGSHRVAGLGPVARRGRLDRPRINLRSSSPACERCAERGVGCRDRRRLQGAVPARGCASSQGQSMYLVLGASVASTATPDLFIERTPSGKLRLPAAAAHVKR